MLKEILPENIFNAIQMLKFDKLCEIRMRIQKPISVNYNNTYYFLGQSGLCNEKDAIICTSEMLHKVLSKASKFSIYSINEELKRGYITAQGGIRIGVVGEVVQEKNEILTVKNFSSINIRIPHQIAGSAYKISKFVLDSNIPQNTLIVGSPGTGKTTILRDLCNQVYNIKKDCNILLLDERMELACCVQGVPQLKVGGSTDVITGGEKHSNITNGIRSMSPDIIAVDEIGSLQDIKAIEYAVNCGVAIFATIHSKNIQQLVKKEELKYLLNQKAFKRIVELSNENGKGTIENIYDENLKPILRFIWLNLYY